MSLYLSTHVTVGYDVFETWRPGKGTDRQGHVSGKSARRGRPPSSCVPGYMGSGSPGWLRELSDPHWAVFTALSGKAMQMLRNHLAFVSLSGFFYLLPASTSYRTYTHESATRKAKRTRHQVSVFSDNHGFALAQTSFSSLHFSISFFFTNTCLYRRQLKSFLSRLCKENELVLFYFNVNKMSCNTPQLAH